ncbi:hypothetical protein [Streptomyces sp. NPDC093094]|uniref:hypothetical protein n=1 Tax=Streptomyces sp. NPDC093094 TaxID=3366026 RepID=UPI003829845E
MHRTTTTATLLVTVAVSALTGCVTVQRPPTAGPPAAPSQPAVPHADGRAGPQVVQAPAREALEAAGSGRTPAPQPSSGPSGPGAQRSAPRGAVAEPPPRAPHPERPRGHVQPRPDEPRHSRDQAPAPRIPEGLRESVRRNADVCALGRKYGGWRAGSPETVACERAYGR